MDRDEYQALRESGGLVADAALQDEEQEFEEVEAENEETDELSGGEDDHQEIDDDDLPELPDNQKTAFEKRMERERTKERERLEAEFRQKYGKHQEIIDMLGGDVDAVEKRIREQRIVNEAQRVAEANGWGEEDTQWYIEQQKQQQELKELRVQMQINKLRDNPDYAGIGSMERDILSKIDKTGGALTVEEAYWALGGKNKADQIKLEAQARESEKRKRQPRTVLTDSPTSNIAEKPLPADVVRDAERMGLTPAEARRLMNNEPAKDLAEWRKRKQAK